jgi:hypothetical protein
MGRRRGGEEMFPGAETLHVPCSDHFDLLNHDDVYVALRQWLADRSDPSTKEEARRERADQSAQSSQGAGA